MSIVAITRREQTPYHMLCFSLNLASERVPKYTSCCLNSSKASFRRPYSSKETSVKTTNAYGQTNLPRSSKRLAGRACEDSRSRRAGQLTAGESTAPARTVQRSLSYRANWQLSTIAVSLFTVKRNLSRSVCLSTALMCVVSLTLSSIKLCLKLISQVKSPRIYYP